MITEHFKGSPQALAARLAVLIALPSTIISITRGKSAGSYIIVRS